MKWMIENLAVLLTLLLIFVSAGLVYLIARNDEKSRLATSTNNLKADSSMVQVRKIAAVSGFYPKDKDELNQILEQYLNEADLKSEKGKPRILIVPHAGLDYSGSVAAEAYKQVIGKNISKVIVIGSSHKQAFETAAVITAGEWETPLGNIQIASYLAGKIISPEQNIVYDAAKHEDDHNLEMQMIWIKKVLENAQVVPIMVSVPSEELKTALAFKIAELFDEETLLVISSDLSHYPDYETARTVDNRTIKAILSGNQEIFKKDFEIAQKQFKEVETLACGHESIEIGLKVAELLNFNRPLLLKYKNSGDVSENKEKVVGYAAIEINSEKINFSVPNLDEAARNEALKIAELSLKNRLLNEKNTSLVTNQTLLEPLGAFVTIRNKDRLRGCIGEFEPSKPLYRVIEEKTVAAATKDMRFKPVTKEELNDLELEISVMTPKKRIWDWREIKLGEDGVVIMSGNKAGTFLPQVATETDWTLEKFLEELCGQKAGLEKNCYLDEKTEIYTFQVQVFAKKLTE